MVDFTFYLLRMMEAVVTTGAIRCAKLQSNHLYTFDRPDTRSVAQQRQSTEGRKKY